MILDLNQFKRPDDERLPITIQLELAISRMEDEIRARRDVARSNPIISGPRDRERED